MELIRFFIILFNSSIKEGRNRPGGWQLLYLNYLKFISVFWGFWKSNLIRKSIIKVIRFEVYLSVQLKWFLSKFFLKTSTNFSRTLRINCKSMTCNIRKFIENFQQLLTICNHFADSLLLIFVLTFPSNSLIYQRMNSFPA